ncbi:MAG: cell division protein FtsZ, partial [Caulobacter sp.]|nr:cell division protein FtsZ [Caulobacter sp.]
IRVSVVATGMDGASMAQIEPKAASRNTTAAPLVVDTARPGASAPAPQAEPVQAASRYEVRGAERPAAATTTYAAEPFYVTPESEPEVVAEEEQADLYFSDDASTEAAAEPRITASARPVTRIVDPAVAEAEEEPLYSEATYEDRRQQKGGGWMSLFGGRQRYEPQPAPQPQARATGGARAALQPLETPQAEEGEDLEIPSFLRRLAN